MTLAIDWIGSPNKRYGRAGFRPEAIVIHIMEGTLAGTDAWFLNSASKVSAHYGVGTEGQIHQYVLDTDTSYHAGRRRHPSWRLIRKATNPNLYTLGIEHEGYASTEWSESMKTASGSLIAELARRWAIRLDRDHVIGHREIFDGKTCPGEKADLPGLIEVARREALDPRNYNFISEPQEVKVRLDLNLRFPTATTESRIKRVLRAGTVVPVTGWTSNGQNVSGNAHWYRHADGGYFWAGGTTLQLPGSDQGETP
jgi:N-acetyl-anhydromuramyl-L-alanine amidase AmpD